jgi:predicted RecB family nuclease
MAEKITRDVLESHLACRYKGHLKLAGQQGSKSNYESWLTDLRSREKVGSIANLIAHHREREIIRETPLVVSTLKTGPAVILDGTFESELFSLGFDGLIKVQGPSDLGQFHYVPLLFHEGQVRATQRVLLELFCLVLQELQGRAPATALIWRSADNPATIRVAPGLKAAKSIMGEIKQVQTGASVQMLVLNDHCQACEFRDSCYAQALKEDNLSLLRGMNKLQITRLNNKGIFTVNQLSYNFKARRRPKRAKKSAIVHHFPLQALAIRDKKVFVHGNPALSCADTRIYLDIEGTQESGSYYLIGIITIADGRQSCDAYWADSDSRQDQIRIFENLLEHLRHHETYSLLHFGSYETKALRRMKAYMTESGQREIDEAIKRSINVLSVISPYIYFPTYSNSLKDLGRFLGYQWSDPFSSGVQSLIWRAQWLESHSMHLKTKLIQYNYEDCIALKGVVEFVETALREGAGAPLRVNNDAPIVYTDTLMTAGKDEWHLFGPTHYALEDFRVINPFSYFDYQRDKVFARNKNTSISRKVGRKHREPHKPNKIVEIRAGKCPSCHNSKIRPLSQCAHEVIDLRFSRGGIRRWIVRYISWRYCCVRCKTRFVSARFQQHRKAPKYGSGLISWCIYQLLIGGQNVHRIHRSLRDLFGLSLPKGSVYKFKRTAASFYKGQYEKILKTILAGSLIHIDETSINLMKEKGYVWVITSADSVYFFYRKSREGSFLGDMLKQFRGVLVSDFYTAYDSFDIPQQRCLIHLMRDMNDDLLKNPFDDEFKSLAETFSSLLRTIVNTIDRYGLKKRHLNKHRRDANKFVERIAVHNFTSEVARGYARRINKYRNMLFTFLAHDGVPWNNNNAEHAIKSFAKYRRFADGVVTENTVKDYLVMLSVCLSCEYRGIEFLKVLLGDGKRGRSMGQRGFRPFRPKLRGSSNSHLVSTTSNDQLALGRKERPCAGQETEKCKTLVLNRALPRILYNVTRSMRGIRFRTAFAVDLWPVTIIQSELEDVFSIVSRSFRETMRRRQTIIIAARNIRFDKPESATGLIGRYVVISISDGGHVVSANNPLPLLDRNAIELGSDQSLNQVYAFAEAAGGAATIMSTRTARNVVTTIVRIYLVQYCAKHEHQSVVGFERDHVTCRSSGPQRSS